MSYFPKCKNKIDGLVQERCDPSVLAMELRLSYINPSKCTYTLIHIKNKLPTKNKQQISCYIFNNNYNKHSH